MASGRRWRAVRPLNFTVLALDQLVQRLRWLVQEFQSFLNDEYNSKLIQEGDAKELVALLGSVTDLQGDVNRQLQIWSVDQAAASWLYNKYSGYHSEVSRHATTRFNLLYVRQRERGYGEWDAKRNAETDEEYLAQSFHVGRLQLLVNHLKVLADVNQSKLQVLQQLSNNFRAEMRGDKASL